MKREHLSAWIRRAPAVLIVLLTAFAGMPPVAEAAHWFARTRFTVESGLAYDNNVHRQNDRTGDAAFLPFFCDLRHDLYRTRANRLRLHANLLGSRYTEYYNEDANKTTLRLRADFRREVFDASTGQLRLHIMGSLRRHRQVYVSRIAGEEYTVDVEDVQVSLRDRFNSTTTAGFLTLYYRSPFGFQAIAESEFSDKDYDEDYDDISTVESLDQQLLVWRLRLIRPMSWGRIRAGYETTKREYRDYSAIDSLGALKDNIHREYRYHEMVADVELELPKGWQLTARMRFRARRDQYVGYYDYDHWFAGPVIEGPGFNRSRFEASYGWRMKMFPRAHVARKDHNPLRREVTHFATAEVSHDIHTYVTLFLWGRAIWHDTRNDAFVYDRVRTWLGVRYTGIWR